MTELSKNNQESADSQSQVEQEAPAPPAQTSYSQPSQQISQNRATLCQSNLNWVVRWALRILLLWGMGVLLVVLFAPNWMGLLPHEILGISVLVFVVVHLNLNLWFWTQLTNSVHSLGQTLGIAAKAADRPPQTLHLTLDRSVGLKLNQALQQIIGLGLILSLSGTFITGVVCSQELFVAIPWEKLGATFNNIGWRSIHMMCAYYVLVFVGLHVGLHLHTLWAFLLRPLRLVVQIATLIMAVHGTQVWIDGDYAAILLGQQLFGFWDFEASILLFFTDKLAVVAALAWLAHLVQKLGWYLVQH